MNLFIHLKIPCHVSPVTSSFQCCMMWYLFTFLNFCTCPRLRVVLSVVCIPWILTSACLSAVICHPATLRIFDTHLPLWLCFPSVSTCIHIYLSISVYRIYLSVRFSICLFIYVYLYLSIHLSACLTGKREGSHNVPHRYHQKLPSTTVISKFSPLHILTSQFLRSVLILFSHIVGL